MSPSRAFAGSAGRIVAALLRNLYLLRSSWPRLVDLAYWPTVQMIMWGLITRYFSSQGGWAAGAAGVLIGAVLLWDILYRAQLGVSTGFMEELYARNLAQLFVSPLRPWELAVALTLIALLRTVVGVGTAALLAIALYQYSIFDLGLPFVAFFVNLMIFGWGIGLALCSALMRWGLGVEGLAWASIFALAPVSGIYYPVATLPAWAQPIAWALPSSYVFEGLRAVLQTGQFDAGLWLRAFLLACLYLGAGFALFLRAFEAARERGQLLRVGE
ncbi:MAG: ABC transporter permease [Gammaproteobacteria bacterium]